ncbi:helix-turn-helix transcriptional regulator [Candidatus Woesearchaeota archaeon]|nr:helix-turn-helix transcriptional regulator [Candidatus Woesearchaeota archaeon]
MRNNLKKYRKILKLDQKDLAKELSVSRQTIINIESGKHDPSLVLAFKVAKIFNSRIEDLFEPEVKKD